MTRAAPILIACLMLAACQSNPKQTVLNLDTTDPRWKSAECVQARKDAADYDDREGVRAATAVAGLVAGVPAAGAIANLTLNAAQDRERKKLNRKVLSACISDPLHGKGAKPKGVSKK
ncbi:MAG: hypothetical protein ACM3W4_09860 [Ignavibacteriales bacterium]